MMMPCVFDPELHEIVNHPARDLIARETGEKDLIVYRHKFYETWVLAYLTQGWMLEVGFLCGEDEKSQHPTRADIARLVGSLKTYLPKQEYLKNLKAHRKAEWNAECEDQERMDDAIYAIYRAVHKTYGAHKAEDYLRANNRMDLARRPMGL